MLSFKKSKKIRFNFKNSKICLFLFLFLENCNNCRLSARYREGNPGKVLKFCWLVPLSKLWTNEFQSFQIEVQPRRISWRQIVAKVWKEIFRQIKQGSFWPSRNLISLNILFNNAVLYSILDPNRMNWSFIEDHIEESSLFRIVESY